VEIQRVSGDQKVSGEEMSSRSAVQIALKPEPPCDRVSEQLERILASRLFTRSSRLCRFLRYSVEEALSGQGDRLKEQLIGIQVFDRKSDYDPRIDPIVRVEARRLRQKLKSYYTSQGRADDVVIALPKGTYAAVFKSRSAVSNTGPAEVQAAKPRAEKSIAVLPFTNLTQSAQDDYFSDGLTEELIHLLTRIPALRVVAWPSASQLRGREQDLAGLRRELHVGTVLRGSVRRTGDRVRVTAQLIDSGSGDYLWSEAFDRKLENIFAIQEEMARAIVVALELKLTGRDHPPAKRKAPQPACYNLCLQGRYHANKRTREGLEKSVVRFEEAVQADDSCAEAYAGLADAYSLLTEYGFLSTAEGVPKARSAAERALELDPQSAEANVSLAFVRSLFEWQWTEAESLYRAAIAANPGYSRARHWYGQDFLALLGRLDEASEELRVAQDLDPLSMIIREGNGYVPMLRRDYPRARALYLELIDLDPSFYKGHSSLGRVLALMGRYDEAIASFERARALAGPVPSLLSALGGTLARAGRIEPARQLLAELHELEKTRWIPLSSFAILHLGLGEHEQALTFLEAATDRRQMAVAAMKVHPLYDPLRSEPRFTRLLERIGLLR
jgi:serine/threonine-protein kinase